MSNAIHASEVPAPEAPQSPAPQSVKKKKKRTGALARFIRRCLLVLLTLVLLAAAGLAMVLNQVFNGPSMAARADLTLILARNDAVDWIPALFIGEEAAAQILENADASEARN